MRLSLPSLLATAAALSVGAAPLQAQTSGDYALGAVRGQWKQVTDNILKAAEEMTETEYAYRPTKEVRSFGELVAHVAGAQASICAVALGDKPAAEDDVEKTAKSKGDIVAALKRTTAYCAKAYQLTATRFNEPVDLFGSKSTKFGALALNLMHNSEHYGNLVTYMRLQGKVPPTSRR